MREESEGSDPSRKLFIGGLSRETTKDGLEHYFARFGKVVHAVVVKDQQSGNSRGFGFVTFAHPDDAAAVLRNNSHLLDTKTIHPKPYRKPGQNQKPNNSTTVPKQLHVGGLTANITEFDLESFFNIYGKVVDVTIRYNQKRRNTPGYGFVTFETEDAVERLLGEHSHLFIHINGSQIKVKRAENRNERSVPRKRQQPSQKSKDDTESKDEEPRESRSDDVWTTLILDRDGQHRTNRELGVQYNEPPRIIIRTVDVVQTVVDEPSHMSRNEDEPENDRLTQLTVKNTALAGALIITLTGLAYLAATTSHKIVTLPWAGGHYGDICNTSSNVLEKGNCSSDFHLICDPVTSRCRCEAGMFLDANTKEGHCVAKVGAKCSNYIEEGARIKHCTGDAECLPDGFHILRCYCKRHYLPNQFGACVPTHDGHCGINAHCSPNSFLKCGAKQTCTCDFENNSQVWNATMRKCASLIGADCTPDGSTERPCIDPSKSHCEKVTDRAVCKCNPGFVPTSGNHRCAVPYDGPCDSTPNCADGLVCGARKRCSCQKPEDQIYDNNLSHCVAYAGASCKDILGHSCVANAICQAVLTKSSTCSCIQNFQEKDRFCVKNSAIVLENNFWLPLISVYSMIRGRVSR